jgi:hypothetical protein
MMKEMTHYVWCTINDMMKLYTVQEALEHKMQVTKLTT